MTTRWMTRTVGLAITAVLGSATLVAAQWSDRTILTFSAPVMVPGATLQAGAYVFEILESSSSRHLVQIRNQDTSKIITLTQAAPMKRADAKGDVVVQFSPTDAGSPPALKGYFAPGSIYGHEFVYPDAQAKEIANRTKTIVLSVDIPGSDLQKGTLRTYNPSGTAAEWKGDAATVREWDTWQRNHPAAARASAGSPEERRESTALMVKGEFQATRVKIDDLEDNPKKYIGQTVSVDAEVEEVFGPRLFTIDEAHWGDLAGEIMVLVPTTMAALVKEDDRVTITGTVRPFVRTEVEREWGWLGLDRESKSSSRKSRFSWRRGSSAATTTRRS